MAVFFEGSIAGIRKGEWAKQPGATPTKYASLQFAEKSDRPDDESIRFIEVSLPDGDDGSAYKVGQTVKLQVRVTARDKKIYYRAESGRVPGGARPSVKP
jgi:hypothetical protein